MALSKNEMGWSHPDLNALAAFMDERLSEADRAGVMAHLAECFECRVVVAAHARGVDPSVQADELAGRRARWRFRPAVWFPVAATLTLATTAVVVWRIDRGAPEPTSRPPIVSEPARPKTATPVPVAPDAQNPARLPAPPPTVTVPPTRPDSLATRRNAVRVVNGKTFRLVAGDWIDSAYDPPALLPLRDIAGPDARTDVLKRIPTLAQFAGLGPNVTVVHDGIVYRFRR